MNATLPVRSAHAKTARTFAFAVIPSHGCYGSGARVDTIVRTNDLDRALTAARKATADYRARLSRHGGTSGGYRVVRWDSAARSLDRGWMADLLPTVA